MGHPVDSRKAAPVDSRRWTGPAPVVPVPSDRRAARAAFRAAGGPGATAPQRAAASISWIGLVLMLPVAILGAEEGSWLPGLKPLAARARIGLEGWLAAAGFRDGGGLAQVLGDPRVLATLLAMAGTLAGLAAAYRNRTALARGFAAAETGRPDAVFVTLRHWEIAPWIMVLCGFRSPEGPFFALNTFALWIVARFAAASLVAVAERRAAGLGTRGAAPSGWDAATIALSLAAMLLMLAHALGWLG